MLQVSARTGFALCVTVLVCSCTCRGVPKGFFLQPPSQQAHEFQKYDFETQYRIYICSQQKVEPPLLGLAAVFAREGSRIVTPLKVKLANADDDKSVRDIAFVFKEMSRLRTYDVAGDKALMRELRDKISAMQDPFWRQMAEDGFQAIRARSSAGQPEPRAWKAVTHTVRRPWQTL